jgi:hypothetical protein
MKPIKKILLIISRKMRDSFLDLLPIILVIFFFQAFVLQQGIPDFKQLLFGSFLVWLGLMFFIEGLEMVLFPIGNTLAVSLSKKGNFALILTFAFLLGFSTVIAEPALLAISEEATRIVFEANLIDPQRTSPEQFSLGLRVSVALAVGCAILIGMIRIAKGWPIQWVIIPGYIAVIVVTLIAPKEIIGIAFDSGGVATSTITVPLITALGIGFASTIKGRNPMVDGFGLIGIAVMLPMLFVMLYGLVML